MGLRIKNYRTSLKNSIFKGGRGGGGRFSQKKYIYWGQLPKKSEGLIQFADLRGGRLGRKEWVFLKGVDNPMRTMILTILCRYVSSS